jgi:hypothetical protein
MGLDISYASNVTLVACERAPDCGHLKVYDNSAFPGRAAPLVPGCYDAASDDTEPCAWIGFRAGSYSGYSEWRDHLARLAGAPSANAVFTDPAKYATLPFIELINFSDCEGEIGATVARKLAADFALFDNKARTTGHSWFYPLYQHWHRAFTAAADDGVVSFH